MKRIKKISIIFVLLLLVGGLVACNKNDNNKPEDKTIKVYTRDTTSGTRDGFMSGIGLKEAVADDSKLVAGVITTDGNGQMINYLKGDEFGIGYISLSSLATSTLKGLKYDNVDPTEANVISGTYKLTRNFNYIIRSEFANEKEEQLIKAFVAYMTTQEGKAVIKSKGGIVSVSADDPTWESIKGNHPVTAEDNKGITLNFGGSTSVESVSKALSQAFSEIAGNFVPAHNHGGSGDAYKRTQGSEKDSANGIHIGFLSRELKTDEAAASDTSGLLAIDAIVAVVNSKNELSAITKDLLQKIYTGQITKWSEVK